MGRPRKVVNCSGSPCAWCGGCSTCFDYHFYQSGHACTDDSCPREIRKRGQKRLREPALRILEALSEPKYGMQLMQDLDIASGVMYPILRRLVASNYVVYLGEKKTPIGAARKMYLRTGFGTHVLKRTRMLKAPRKRHRKSASGSASFLSL